MTKEIDATDEELMALMEELEGVTETSPVEPEPAPVPEPVPTPVVEPEPEPEVEEAIDLNRVVWIHNTNLASVYKGTAKELSRAGIEEVSASEGLRLTKAYKAEELAKAKPVVVESPPVDPEPEPKPKPVTAPKPKPVPVAEPEPAPVTVSPAGLKHYVDADQFQKDTRVSDVDLDRCMIEQNSLRSHYGTQAAHAEAQASRLKARFEIIEATLFDHHRKEFVAAGEKATVQMIDSAAKMDPRWLKAKDLLIEAETIAAINKSLVESLKDRRDMIIQLGADRRDEGKGATRILVEQQERQELRDRALNSARKAA